MKPIAILDFETTGTDVMSDWIVQVAILKVPGVKQEKERFESLVDPGVPIPEEASEVHGITNEKVKDAPPWRVVGKQVAEFIEGCDLAGFNSNQFDIPLMMSCFNRVKIDFSLEGVKFLDASVMFKRMHERTLSAAVKLYCNRELEDAHDAMADVEGTYDVFVAMLKAHPELRKMNRSELALFSNYDTERCDVANRFYLDDEGDYRFNFGKHKGMKAKSHPGFLRWMLNQNFLPDTLAIVNQILKK